MLHFTQSPVDGQLGFFLPFPSTFKNSIAPDSFVQVGKAFLLGINLEVELASLLFVDQLALRIKPFRVAVSYHCALDSVVDY